MWRPHKALLHWTRGTPNLLSERSRELTCGTCRLFECLVWTQWLASQTRFLTAFRYQSLLILPKAYLTGLSWLDDHSAHLDMYILLVAYLIHLDMFDFWLYIIMIIMEHAIIVRYSYRLACV